MVRRREGEKGGGGGEEEEGKGRIGEGEGGEEEGEEELGVYVQHLYYRVMITSTNDNTQCTQW